MHVFFGAGDRRSEVSEYAAALETLHGRMRDPVQCSFANGVTVLIVETEEWRDFVQRKAGWEQPGGHGVTS
jgi:hypothetical protein